jgi:hypothetical protein
MNRREAIRRTAILMGGAVSAPAIMGILKGCKAKPTINWKPIFFTEEQAMVITNVSEIILPATDTPGAKEVGVPAFIEQMIHEVYSPEDRDSFMSGLAGFINDAKLKFGDPFIDLEAEQQTEYVSQLHEKALKAKDQNENKKRSRKNETRPFVLKMKELTMLGFFTSEVGATKVLQYEQVPGHYFGCRPLSEVGKTWA